jgi:hypothetical protein
VHPPKPKRGRVVNSEAPVWEPLFELASEHLNGFAWMHEVELEDGTRLHAYRHQETRRYLHLDHSGRAFVVTWGESREGELEYEEADPRFLLDLALARSDERASLFRQKISAEFKRIRWVRSATKHRISRKRIRHVIEHAAVVLEEEPPVGHPTATDNRLVFLGDDASGIALEVIAVEPADGSLLVIHAMELRPRFKAGYREVRRWQR